MIYGYIPIYFVFL